MTATPSSQDAAAGRARRPWLAAIGFALLPLLLVVPANVLAQVLELDEIGTRLVVIAAVALSFAG